MGERLAVFVLSVTTDLADEAGADVAERVEAAGAALAGRDMVPPAAEAIDAALARRLGDEGVGAVLVVGGAELPTADLGARAVGRLLRLRLPGVSEAVRAVGRDAVGPEAALWAPVGGVTAGRKLLFSLPGHAAGAAAAAEQVVLPLLATLRAQLAAASAVPADEPVTADDAEQSALVPVEDDDVEQEAAPVPAGVSVVPFPDAVAPEDERPELATGWEAGMRALGGALSDGWPELPEALERLAPVCDVLNTAGQRAVMTCADGRRYAAFGFPDLKRTSSKVLLVRDGEPLAEIVALHRHPAQAGLLVYGDDGALPSADLLPGPVAERLTGRTPPGGGSLFALDAGAIYLSRERRVFRWDGRRETPEGTTTQALASLVLRWSQR